MTINVQRGVGLAVGILALISGIAGLVMGAAQRFAALDTRLGKLESAIRTLNATTPDERYKTLIKELMADAHRADPDAPVEFRGDCGNWICKKNCTFTPDVGPCKGYEQGAAADALVVKVPQ